MDGSLAAEALEKALVGVSECLETRSDGDDGGQDRDMDRIAPKNCLARPVGSELTR